MNRVLAAVAVAAAIAIVTVAGLALHMKRFLDTPLDVPADGVTFEIAPGTAFARVSRQLEEQGILSDARRFRWYASWTDKAGSIHAGEYRITPGTTPIELLQQFTSGDVRLYSFTIIEGWNHRELLAALADAEGIVSTLSDEDWPVLLAELGIEHGHPEGLFLPETYHYPRGTTDRELLKQAHRQLEAVLDEEWAARDESSPVATPYEALILASIVEKETARADERAKIAGVFARRLQNRMRLETDPTVIYGIGPDFNGNLTRRDLETDTPYNTYTRHGLPPTPIAMAGRAAIHAALHPEPGSELYFVATGLGDGSHKFSTTYDEHRAAVSEYLQRLREKRNQGR